MGRCLGLFTAHLAGEVLHFVLVDLTGVAECLQQLIADLLVLCGRRPGTPRINVFVRQVRVHGINKALTVVGDEPDDDLGGWEQAPSRDEVRRVDIIQRCVDDGVKLSPSLVDPIERGVITEDDFARTLQVQGGMEFGGSGRALDAGQNRPVVVVGDVKLDRHQRDGTTDT